MKTLHIILGLTVLIIAYIIFIVTKKPIPLNPIIPPCKLDSDCVPSKQCVTAVDSTTVCIDPHLPTAMTTMMNGNNASTTDCTIYKQSTVVSSTCIQNAFQQLSTDMNSLDTTLAGYIASIPSTNTTYITSLNKLLVNGHIPGVSASQQLVSNINSAYSQIQPFNEFNSFLVINAGYAVFSGIQISLVSVTNNFNSWAALLASTVTNYPGSTINKADVPVIQISTAVNQVLTDFNYINTLLPMVINQAGIVIKFAE